MDAQLPAGQLAGLARLLGISLPYPFVDLDELASGGAETTGDRQLAKALWLIAEPHLCLYVAAVDARGDLSRVAAVETNIRECFLLAATAGGVRLKSIDQRQLVQSLVEATGQLGALRAAPLFERSFAVSASVFAANDSLAAAEALRQAGTAERQVQEWLAAGSARGSGTLGVYYGGLEPRHVGRSVSWRAFAGGSVLAVERVRRARREAEVDLMPLDERTLTRAAMDLLTSLNTTDAEPAGQLAGSGR